MSASGLESQTRGPSTFRLPINWFGTNPTLLVIAEASDQQKREEMSLFMPKDKLNMRFDCRGTFAIASGSEADPIFARLPSVADEGSSFMYVIDFDAVYAAYGQQVVNTTTRAVLVKYSIEQVISNRELINAELEKLIAERLKGTPVRMIHYGLSAVQPPDLIVEAEKQAKEREVEIDRARADRMVKLTEAEADLEVALKQQQVDLLQADTQRQVGLRLTTGVNLAFVQQRVLSSLEKLSKANDKVIIVPDEAFRSPAVMTAVSQNALNGNSGNK